MGTALKKVKPGSEAAIALFTDMNFDPLRQMILQYREVIAENKKIEEETGSLPATRRQLAFDMAKAMLPYRYPKPGTGEGNNGPVVPVGITVNVMREGDTPPPLGQPFVPPQLEQDIQDAVIVEDVKAREAEAVPVGLDEDWLK